MEVLEKNRIKVDMAARYIDDIRQAMNALRRGWRWNGKELEHCQEWEQEDKASKKSGAVRTGEVVNKIMDGIYSDLKFTTETGEEFENGRLPTLDMEMWIENGRILYSYYEKPVAAKTVINQKSALSENTKMASLSQDLIRRMKNTTERLDLKHRIAIIDKYAAKILSSGYSRVQTRRIVVAGLTGYERALARHRSGIFPLRRSAKAGAKSRNRKKLLAKTSWFKDRKNESSPEKKMTTMEKPRKEQEKKTAQLGQVRTGKPATPSPIRGEEAQARIPVTTVLFVEQTPGGEYARRMREAEEVLARITGWRVKIVERSGTTMKQLLVKADPWDGGTCGREECMPCKSGEDNSKCFKRNILYETSCVTCAGGGKPSRYVGESSRSGFERAAEHFSDYKNEKSDSHMLKHAMEEHPGEIRPSFKFKVTRTFQNAMKRQISEAVRIRRVENSDVTILNSKGVYNRCSLPRLVVEVNSKVLQDGLKNRQHENHIQAETFQTTFKSKRRRDNERDEEQLDDQGVTRRCKRRRWCGNYAPGQVWGERKVEKSIQAGEDHRDSATPSLPIAEEIVSDIVNWAVKKSDQKLDLPPKSCRLVEMWNKLKVKSAQLSPSSPTNNKKNGTGTKRKDFQEREERKEKKKRKVGKVQEKERTSVKESRIAMMWRQSGEAGKRNEQEESNINNTRSERSAHYSSSTSTSILTHRNPNLKSTPRNIAESFLFKEKSFTSNNSPCVAQSVSKQILREKLTAKPRPSAGELGGRR